MLRSDEATLLAELHGGEAERPRWTGFLEHLQRRCGADEATLLFRHVDDFGAPAATWRALRGGGKHHDQPRVWPLIERGKLRPQRVYSFEELSEAANAPTPRYGRVVRAAEGAWSAWIAIARDADDFTAANTALLSALAPQLAIAMRNFAALERERLRSAIMDDALSRAGIAWRALKDDGAAFAEGGARNTSPASGLDVPAPLADLAAQAPIARVVLSKVERPLDEAQLDHMQSVWRLSQSEARLCAALCNGESLAEAAEAIGLTLETARNYSKRIFAKTGARGQADLVRIVLTSVAVLA